eukprot:Hpha_TRINITY_DN5647_c0_g1::TRINITY_DN5647_c0_g1_i1::g.50627::m.50627
MKKFSLCSGQIVPRMHVQHFSRRGCISVITTYRSGRVDNLEEDLGAARLPEESVLAVLGSVRGLSGTSPPVCATSPGTNLLARCLERYKLNTGRHFPAPSDEYGWAAAAAVLLSHSPEPVRLEPEAERYRLVDGGNRGVEWAVRAEASPSAEETGTRRPGDEVWGIEHGEWLRVCSQEPAWVRRSVAGAGWVKLNRPRRSRHLKTAGNAGF